jgi:high-affinity nickel-transport protein
LLEALDMWLGGLLEGAPLLLALGVAFVLGLRHATDPDHLVAVTSLVVADERDVRAAVRLGAWWGVGHSAILLAIGLPLIAFKEELPGWLERGAETAVAVVIVVLAVRVIVRWLRPAEPHPPLRTARQALAIGMLHGLAGTGAVVLLLVAALPDRLEAAAALAVFAPMSIVSMALCTSAFAWALTRGELYRTVLVPAVGAFGLAFGLWYAL